MTLADFVNISALLTGYDQQTLKPQNDTQQLSETYFATLNKEVSADVLAQLLAAFQSLPANPSNEQVVNTILAVSPIGAVAKNIIQMWYTGIWYTNATAGEGYVISATTYRNGLVWSAMGAHPMGFSEENFGYWSDPPQMPVIGA